ncbi:vicilin Cor a 11.0101-like [Andrographis paniculata]|uniref:vicilin Cor a 11.0101-like n=1 Tax=Andrographis paniculata TaxID=175694 RepID=UPI0021E77894|nr:vicilin Cor a 11.0101-like [Andrographis paniculata]
MAINFTTKLTLLSLLALALLILPSHCYTRREEEEDKSPEGILIECFTRCSREQPSEGRSTDCERKCVVRYKQQKEEQQEERRRGGGGEEHNRRDPEQRFRECQSRCEAEQGERKQHCQQRCRQQFEKERREQRGEGNRREREEEGEDERQESQNPYYFESKRFDTKFKNQEGHIKVLERFSKRSELLQGIDNDRVAFLEANPQTIILPHHADAEAVFAIVRGKGTINYIWKNQRLSFNLKRGDVIRVPAGSIGYLINNDNEEKLYALNFLRPINTPGKYEAFYGVGGENPESFFNVFSNEILEAAFKSPRKDVKRLFGQQNKGVIIKASEEQIRALSQESESSRGRRGGENWGPINLFEQRPLSKNEYGQHLEASPEQHEQLKDLDLSVGFVNIKKGAMTAPYYNSRSTKLVFVVRGRGRFEMACPHLSSSSKREQNGDTHYEKASADLSVGDLFVFPAGHPIAIVAHKDSDLELVSFGIRGSNNQKYFLAGRDSVWEKVQAEAKELSFRLPAKEVEEILRRQGESQFLAGPNLQKQEREGRFVGSILDFAGF